MYLNQGKFQTKWRVWLYTIMRGPTETDVLQYVTVIITFEALVV